MIGSINMKYGWNKVNPPTAVCFTTCDKTDSKCQCHPETGDPKLIDMNEWITTSDGIPIAYDEVGAGDPAIIFIHGAYGKREDRLPREFTSLPVTGASRSTCAATATATS